jgi:hypothetical protein
MPLKSVILDKAFTRHLVSEFPSTLVWKQRIGKMGLSCRLQAAGQWHERARCLLALAIGQVRGEPEPFGPVS